MNFPSKALRVLSDPRMLLAYGRWIMAGRGTRFGPRVPVSGSASLGAWSSFSEYLTFQDGISRAEASFMERCIARAPLENRETLDVGANVGAFTMLLANAGSVCHAFEPVPETFCRLSRNVLANELSSKVRLNCMAVGSRTGLVSFDVRYDAPATNRIASSTDDVSPRTGRRQTVATIDLDAYCESQGLGRVAVAKVDVEGMEPLVLRGARRLLESRRIQAVLIEVCPSNLRQAGFSCEDLWREWTAVGWTGSRLNDDGSLAGEVSLADLEDIRLENIALLPSA